jgi:hypothetical protein
MNSRQCISAWRRVGHQLLKDWTRNDEIDTAEIGGSRSDNRRKSRCTRRIGHQLRTEWTWASEIDNLGRNLRALSLYVHVQNGTHQTDRKIFEVKAIDRVIIAPQLNPGNSDVI